MKTSYLKTLLGVGLSLSSIAGTYAQCTTNCIEGASTVFASKYYEYWAPPGGIWNPCCYSGTMPTIYYDTSEHISFQINGEGLFYLYNSITSDYKFIRMLATPEAPYPPVVYQTQCLSVILTLGQPKVDNVDFVWINDQGAEVGAGDFYTATTTGNYYLQSRSHEVSPVYGGASIPLYVTIPGMPVDGIIKVDGRSTTDPILTTSVGCPVRITSQGGAGEPHYWASTDYGTTWNVFEDYGPAARLYDFYYSPPAAGTYRFAVRNKAPVCGFCFDHPDACLPYSYVDVIVEPAVYVGSLSVNLGSHDACVGKPIPVQVSGNSGTLYFTFWYQEGAQWKTWDENATMSSSFNFSAPDLSIPPLPSTEWRFETWSVDRCGHESDHASFPVTVWNIPKKPTNLYTTPGDLTSEGTLCQGVPTKMYATPDLSFRTIHWYRTATDFTEIPMNADPYNYTQGVSTGPLNATTTFYAATYQITNAGEGCDGPREALIVPVTPKPVNPALTAENTVCFGNRVKITKSGGIGDTIIYKFSSNSGATWAEFGRNQISVTHAPLTAGTYLYKAISKNICDDCGSASPPASCVSNTISVIVLPRQGCIDRNYIVTNNVIGNNVTDLNAVNQLSIDLVNESVVYFDGLGRLIQNLVKQGSPNKVDLVTPIIYDNMGRQTRQYLPVVSGNDGRFKSGLLDVNKNYVGTTIYSNGAADNIPDDPRPFQETIFEPSPANRVVKTYGAGDSWKTASDKPIQPLVLVNVDGTGANQERIINWQLDGSGQPVRSGSNAGYYPSGKLNIKSIKDENGREVREYVDVLGRTILKKVQAVDTPSLNDPTHWAQTYYIYNDLGNLVFVLPPEGVKALAP